MFIALAWLRALSERMAELLLRLYARLRSDGGDGATRRAERSHQQRLERQEPQFDQERRRRGRRDSAAADNEIRGSRARRARRSSPSLPKAKTSRKATENQATLDLVPDERYDLPPPLDLLDKGAEQRGGAEDQRRFAAEERAAPGIRARGLRRQRRDRAGAARSVVTLYELEPAPGTKTSRVVGLADDVARSMSAVSVRIAVVPGRSVIGIELPNRGARDRLSARAAGVRGIRAHGRASWRSCSARTSAARRSSSISQRMPHLLIAGTTGSGKSVAINTMILSLIYRLSPDACKFIMIDPKMLELSMYDGIPHLLAPVVTEPRKAIVALKWTVREMEQRYRAMSKLGVRNIEGYNLRIAQARDNGETLTRKVQTGFDPETGAPIYEEELDPARSAAADRRSSSTRWPTSCWWPARTSRRRSSGWRRWRARPASTSSWRPSGRRSTSSPARSRPTSRPASASTSRRRIDSRTILGETGAEQLLGQGDMLYMANGGRITRVHGPLVTDREVEAVVRFLKDQGEPT